MTTPFAEACARVDAWGARVEEALTASSLPVLQREVGAWGEETFPEATGETICRHLRDEALELSAAVTKGELLADEAADVLLILLHLCHRNEIDLLAAAREKFERCKGRTWAFDPACGYVRHVRLRDGCPVESLEAEEDPERGGGRG